MEMGNLLFGHSRGDYPIDREELQPLFGEFFDKLNIDTYGFPSYNSPVYQEPTKTLATVDNEIFTIRPYYWGEDEELMKLPNFVYKPEGIEINWYKYALRDSYCNIELTKEKLQEILDKCVDFAMTKQG